MNISAKFALIFGFLLISIIVVALTGYVAFQYVSNAEKTIKASSEIQRLILEMDRGMERARHLHGHFFLQYPEIGFQNAYEKYVEKSTIEIQDVIKKSSLLKTTILNSAFDKWRLTYTDKEIEKIEVDLNFYLSSAKRFEATSLESVDLVIRRSHPEKGLEASLDSTFNNMLLLAINIKNGSDIDLEAQNLKLLCIEMNMLALKYRLSRQRFLMQSAFNVAFELRSKIHDNISINQIQKDKFLLVLDQWLETAQEILTVDVAIKGKFNDFALQANAVDPISKIFVKLSDEDLSKARSRIHDAHITASGIIIIVTLSTICFVIMIFHILNISITRRIIALTDMAAKLRQGYLDASSEQEPYHSYQEKRLDLPGLPSEESFKESVEIKDVFPENENIYLQKERISIDQYGSDEISDLARTFELMAIRMNAMVNNLEEKVKQRTSELEKSQKRLQRAEKMEAMGMLAGGVAHDLNNILSAIIGYPDIILMSLPDGSDLEKPIRAIRDSGQRAAEVVADLLTIARGAANTKTTENINNIIEQYIDSPEFNKLREYHSHVQYHLNCSSDIYNICCSGIHIKKTIMNLIANASEAIDDIGSVTVSTRNEYLDENQASQKGVGKGHYVVLSVTDTGEGIGEGYIKHIFEPFYTRKEMGKSGTGLGLTVVWNTVQDHNGGITVTSNSKGSSSVISSSLDGNIVICSDRTKYSDGTRSDATSADMTGTSFELFFPVFYDKSGNEPFKGETEGKIPNLDLLKGNGERILVVDDEPYQIDLAMRMLTLLNYEVSGVDSGEKALEYLKREQVDLVLLDMIMAPGINGRETYEEIIKINPFQKAIIASGFSESEDVKNARQIGVGGYLKKPYSIEQLAVAVADVLKA
ncbi:MAG: response regulator [Desulfamplus sp.]|nr:response regulator [Desulfamplus sp.]